MNPVGIALTEQEFRRIQANGIRNRFEFDLIVALKEKEEDEEFKHWVFEKFGPRDYDYFVDHDIIEHTYKTAAACAAYREQERRANDPFAGLGEALATCIMDTKRERSTPSQRNAE